MNSVHRYASPLRFHLAVVAGVLSVSVIELLLIDRKYGVFTGGFGVSRKVGTFAELFAFGTAYGITQGLVALLVWWGVRSASGGRTGWGVVWQFLLTFGCGFLLVMGVNYQLHSYFSDAISFALIKQLGGGSLLDAIKFGLVEIALGTVVLLVVGAAFVFSRRLIQTRMRYEAGLVNHARFRLTALLVALSMLLAGWLVPRHGGNASYALGRAVVWRNVNWVFNELTDFDRDGFGLYSVQYDTRPFDKAIHPLALDVPGNGIDEDGFGGDLQNGEVSTPIALRQIASEETHLVVVVLESTRGDVIGKRVGGKAVAPNLEAVTQTGSVFPAYSHVGFTVESLKSIFTGSLVSGPESPSLFTDLRSSGYRIGVFSAQAEDFGGIADAVHMRSPHDVFVDAQTLKDKRAFGFAAQGSLRIDESHLLDSFKASFGQVKDWTGPNFLYFNFQSPHFPYNHEAINPLLIDEPIPRSQISEANKEWVANTYWNSVAYSDHWLGILIAELKRLGVWEKTLLVVTGDHGEDLFDSGFLGHGHLIGKTQNQTFFATNRPVKVPGGQLALSDYRGVILSLLNGEEPVEELLPPFMHVGSIQKPTQIGLAEPAGEVVTLRTDSRVACLGQGRCQVYDDLKGTERERVDALVSRWGRERWEQHLRSCGVGAAC